MASLLRIADLRDRISAIRPTFSISSSSANQVLLHDFRNGTFLLLSTLFTALTLTPTSTLIPGVLALATFHAYARFVFPSVQATWSAVFLVLSIAAGSAIPNLAASQEALDTKALSFVLLTSLSSLTSALVVGFLYVDWKVSRVYPGATSLFFFPTLWTTLWRTVAHISPVGNYLTWTRPASIEGYRWLVPIAGPASQDWITAAWAVVLSQCFQSWYMGAPSESYTDSDSDSEIDNSRVKSSKSSTWTSTPLLAFFLSTLLIPSFIIQNSPLAVADVDNVTSLGVGCILPTFQRYKHHELTLADYIEESKKYQSSAKLLLWPEGAVRFASDEERDAAFEEVRARVFGSYVGVSFEQLTAHPDDPSGRRSYKRTGLAVVQQNHSEPVLLYYKRHLVPIAESYHLSRSLVPPTLGTIAVPAPKGVPPSRWDPSRSHSRDIDITASVCLDFAFPDPFNSISSRPGLILAPARTWEKSVGMSMWLQAKQRATELDSMVLWCDGGEGGVSGVGGGGFEEFQQVGPGSWVRNIGIQYPFNQKRTTYARLEDATVIFYWLLTGGSSLVAMFPRLRLGARHAEADPEASPNLIDI